MDPIATLAASVFGFDFGIGCGFGFGFGFGFGNLRPATRGSLLIGKFLCNYKTFFIILWHFSACDADAASVDIFCSSVR